MALAVFVFVCGMLLNLARRARYSLGRDDDAPRPKRLEIRYRHFRLAAAEAPQVGECERACVQNCFQNQVRDVSLRGGILPPPPSSAAARRPPFVSARVSAANIWPHNLMITWRRPKITIIILLPPRAASSPLPPPPPPPPRPPPPPPPPPPPTAHVANNRSWRAKAQTLTAHIANVAQ